MNAVQAGFDILMMFMWVDGETKDEEVEMISEFLKQNYQGGFDVKEELSLLSGLNPDGIRERFSEAASFLKDTVSLKEKETMLEFALGTIIADNVLDELEIELFEILGEYWGFNVNAFVEDRL